MTDTFPPGVMPITTPCIEWPGAVTREGYPSDAQHRRAWERANGPIPKPLEIDHLCFNPRCIRVDHMEPVTHAENMRRAKARKTHCVHGHEYTPENTGLQVKTSGYVSRYCRQCMRHRKKAAYRAARRRMSE